MEKLKYYKRTKKLGKNGEVLCVYFPIFNFICVMFKIAMQQK